MLKKSRVKITNSPEDIAHACAIVLPGVGAFKRAMDNLTRLEILPSIVRAISQGKPFLGICLGLQILFTESEEHGSNRGLDVIKGKVKKFGPGIKIPHMGWNSVRFKAQGAKRKIFDGIPEGSYFYFVHSYYVDTKDKDIILTKTDYGVEFISGIEKDNIFGVQFHPERSGDIGLKILENFVRL